MALTFDDEQTKALLGPLGLPADTRDPAAVVATVADALADGGLANAAPSAIVAAAKQAGMEVVDADTLAALRQDAVEGRQMKAAVEKQRVVDKVDDAIAKGKIYSSSREHWINLIGADPKMGEMLDQVPNETAVPLTEIGHGIDSEGPFNHAADYVWE